MTLKKKITEIACATSSSSASITGAVAAIAEPPQIEDPTPMSVEIFPGMRNTLHKTNAIISDVVIVITMIGKDCLPVCSTTDRLSPKPSRITAHCNIFLETNVIPDCRLVLSFTNNVMSIPAKIAKTAPPTIGNCLPSS